MIGLPETSTNKCRSKMKTHILLIFATLVVSSLATTDSRTPKLYTIASWCQEEAGLSDEMRNKLKNLEFVDDPKVKKHLLCVWKKIRLVTEDGEIVENKVHKRVKADTQNEEEADKICKKCIVHKDTPEETIFELHKCLFGELPNLPQVE